MNRIKIPMRNGDSLVAEIGNNRDFNEIYVGIVNSNDEWVQDLAIVGQDYSIKDDLTVEQIDDSFRVHVYKDEYIEDPTHSFIVSRYPSH